MPPRNAPSSADDDIVLNTFTGLKNTVSRERLSPQELSEAVNIDLDDKGQPRRRRGYTQVSSNPIHSMFTSEAGIVYGVMSGVLGIINPDYSFTSLGVTIGGNPFAGDAPLAYVQLGVEIYYSGLGTSGIINETNKTVGYWGSPADLILSPVVNPSPTLPSIRIKVLGRPPVATILGYYNGRIYLAEGRTLWCTEPFLYNFIDKNRNYLQFEGDITMIGVVLDGIYIGTSEGCWFLRGRGFPFQRDRVLDSAVIPGSMVYIPGELANPTPPGADAQTAAQVSITFMTTKGYCVGRDGGQAYNLTEERFFFPNMIRSAALYRRQDGVNQYLVVGDSEGQPTMNSRFGDYLDATIIRGGGVWRDMQDGFGVSDFLEATIV